MKPLFLLSLSLVAAASLAHAQTLDSVSKALPDLKAKAAAVGKDKLRYNDAEPAFARLTDKRDALDVDSNTERDVQTTLTDAGQCKQTITTQEQGTTRYHAPVVEERFVDAEACKAFRLQRALQRGFGVCPEGEAVLMPAVETKHVSEGATVSLTKDCLCSQDYHRDVMGGGLSNLNPLNIFNGKRYSNLSERRSCSGRQLLLFFTDPASREKASLAYRQAK